MFSRAARAEKKISKIWVHNFFLRQLFFLRAARAKPILGTQTFSKSNLFLALRALRKFFVLALRAKPLVFFTTAALRGFGVQNLGEEGEPPPLPPARQNFASEFDADADFGANSMPKSAPVLAPNSTPNSTPNSAPKLVPNDFKN